MHPQTAPVRDRTGPDIRARRTRALLTAGAVAGPMFVGVVVLQALTRDGFDLTHQPLSLLSLDELGWVQVTNFVVAGVLMCALAAGLSRALPSGPGHAWAPVLMAVHGAGLVAGGVFRPDPALGYPPGTPDTVPDEFSWHATLHAVAPALAFTALVLCCWVVARRSWVYGAPGWAAYSVLTGVVALLLAAWPGQDTAGPRLFVAVVIGFCWTTLVALDLRRRT